MHACMHCIQGEGGGHKMKNDSNILSVQPVVPVKHNPLLVAGVYYSLVQSSSECDEGMLMEDVLTLFSGHHLFNVSLSYGSLALKGLRTLFHSCSAM